jgi:hypothetical protein
LATSATIQFTTQRITFPPPAGHSPGLSNIIFAIITKTIAPDMASARRCGITLLAQKTTDIAPTRQRRGYANIINLVRLKNGDKIAALKMALLHAPARVMISK